MPTANIGSVISAGGLMGFDVPPAFDPQSTFCLQALDAMRAASGSYRHATRISACKKVKKTGKTTMRQIKEGWGASTGHCKQAK
jgi:hypothetical protein